MQQIIDFFIRNKNFLLFLLLFSFGISLSKKAHSGLYTRNIASSNRISGGIFAQITDIKSYFSLKQRNETLALENARLLAAKHKIKHSDSKDTLSRAGLMPLLDSSNLSVIQAHVINNNYHKRKNTLTIDKGALDGVEMDMGVVSSDGVLGVITHVSDHYCVAQSVLNTNSRIIVKSKKSNHFGTLIWPGDKADELLLTEIPKIAPIAPGDSLVTDGKSTIFPRGWPVGQVIDIEDAAAQDYLDIRVRPHTDMTDLYHVYLLQRPEAQEIRELENTMTDEL
jgi:rod shape-determining protein MreC